jgi:hypothetical protein
MDKSLLGTSEDGGGRENAGNAPAAGLLDEKLETSISINTDKCVLPGSSFLETLTIPTTQKGGQARANKEPERGEAIVCNQP